MSIKSTVLIIGATSGIGRALARSIHAQGKKVIATGRNIERLSALAAELPELETDCWDFSDIHSLPNRVSKITSKYPNLDTVIVNAGIQNLYMFKDIQVGASKTINDEVTTNLTAPIVFCQAIIPFFIQAEKPCSIILISSGLAFVPVPFFPVYCPTKAALHSFAIAMRSQLHGTNINVTEVFPQYVETGLDDKFRDRMIEICGGPEKAPKAMPLADFTEKAMMKLDALEDGKPIQEIGVGAFPEAAVAAWRSSMGPWMARFGASG
ncbi:putative oxidoreductase [Hyphodiscus hymeniophilus]|uniref:Oxidoreductase n=1 Tax=Hyphodiscus hymeniophilus TaxID=353542 RepID=A0A9P6SKX1_9HELO|nr:putative oxidoreductase [Hyphodiscus hymeniophilus]